MNKKDSEKESFTNNKRSNKLSKKIIIILICIIILILLLNLKNKEYTITFETNSSSVIEPIVINKNGTITKPEDPIKQDYEFAGWYYNEELYDFSKPVVENMKLEAKWAKIEKVSNVKLDKTDVVLNLNDTAKLTATILPENASNKLVTWESSNPDIVSVDSEGNIKALKEGTATITATTDDGGYTAKSKIIVRKAIVTIVDGTNTPTIKTYKVTFKDGDGATLSEDQSIKNGSKVTKPEEPTKVGHTFAGWYNGETPYTFEEPVNKNIELVARWTKNKYTITFVNYDGETLDTQIVEYGEIPQHTQINPTKQGNEQYSYIFAGWNPSVIAVENDATYTATFIETINTYEVTFKDGDGTALSNTQIIEYGSKATEPEIPTKVGHTFAGWYNGEIPYTFEEEVKVNVELTAKWTKNKYTITFVNYDGELLETKTQEFGTIPEYTKQTPEKPADKTYTYSFKGWDMELAEVTGNITYTATFTGTYIDYVITFVNEDGTELSKNTYHYGDIVEQPATPTKQGNEQYSYIFVGWNPSVIAVAGDATYTATYLPIINSYEVTFKDEDGSILSNTQKIEYGSKATEPKEPTKVGHTFEGWYNGENKYTFEEVVKGKVELTAKWIKNKYTITFANYNGEILETKIEEYGATPIYTKETPTKSADNTYTYSFKGWDKELAEVTENVTYTATFAETYIDYVITFVNEDGTELSKKTYNYGENVEQPETPTKQGDAQYSYIFVGWKPNVIAVEKDATYTATYVPTINSYEVTFKDEDGSVLANTQKIEYGNKATEPKEPTKVGHTFAGWYNGETKYTFAEVVEGNVELTAKWTKNKYTITFVNYNGEVLETKTQEFGTIPEYTKQTPEKPADNTYTYSFNGWDKELVEVTADITYTAKFAETYIDYVITFVNYDGTKLSENTYHYGENVQQPETPAKPADAQYSYIFVGWNPGVIAVEKNATYTATYVSTINSYEVTFKDEDGKTLSNTQKIEYGSKATEPKEPTKVGHTFAGWYNGETKYTFAEEVKGNVELTAKWIKNKYTITFKNYDGEVLETKTQEYGTIPEYTKQTPEKPADNTYTYSFNGWDKELAEVKENVTYTATFKEVYIDYVITFVNYDGTKLSEKTYHYGEKVEQPETPAKPADAQYTYTFAGWQPSITEVSGNTTYTATYTSTTNSYEVTFKDEDGKTLSDTQKVEYGSKATEPTAPTRIGHTFAGWYNGETKYTFAEEVKGNVELTAKWTKNKYTITFANYDGEVLETKTEEYGTIPEYTKQTPAKPADVQYTYTFAGWQPSITEVVENTTYTATYTSKINSYEVTFKDEDGKTLSNTQKVEYGSKAIEPTAPTKVGHTFAGWYNGEIKYTFAEEVKGNVELTAKWTINKYTITFKNYDGKVLETKTQEYGTIPEYTGQTPIKPDNEQYTYTFSGWNPRVTAVKADITYTAIYTAKVKAYEVTFKDEDGKTLADTQTIEYGGKAIEPTTPTKTGHTFEGWYNGETKYTFAEEVKENVDLIAKWTINKYTITFKNYDGKVLETKTQEHGTTPTYTGTTPTKPADAQYTYTFSGWNPSVTEAVGNTTYTATYTSIINSYEVTFKDEDGSTLSTTQTIEYGSKATKPTVPTKVGHTFEGWYNGETLYTFAEEVKGNIDLIAKWTINKYTITFVNYDGEVLETKPVEYGTTPTYTGQTPTKTKDSEYEYVFTGWEPSVIAAEKDATYTATFKYFVDVDGEIESVITSTNVEKFAMTKNEDDLKITFTSYTITNSSGTTTKKPPYRFTALFNDVVDLLHALSCNENYESVTLYYEHEEGKQGKSIDLKDYDLTDTAWGSWYGTGANDKVGDWIGYLATGTASTTAAFGADSDDLNGKTVEVTIKLKDGYAHDDGTDTKVYYLSFDTEQ